ncbi:MAG TPA: DMT family transporter [Anaerolineales bacterium]|nr:DMT family transporter [Anaerolineales bacterium]
MKTLRSNAILPYLALAGGILCLSFSALFVKWAAAPGPVTAFYRIGLATFILLPFFARHARQASQPALRPGMGWLFLPLLGGLLTALDHAFWNTALLYTSAANATLLGNTAPLWVALFAWLAWRERLKGLFWAGLALTLGGALIVLGHDFLYQPSLGVGDLIALASGVFYAGYFLVTQRARQSLSTLSYVWLVDLIAALALLLICLLLGMPLTGYSTQSYLAFVAAALISQTFGYLSVGYALGHLPASVVSPTLILQPVLTALLAIPLLGEALHAGQWVGGLSVLAGIYLIHRARQ